MTPLLRRLNADDANAYRDLMLAAYARHPDAFTSSAAERGALPAEWWRARLDPGPDASELVLGAFVDERLVGVVGLSFEKRAKALHKATLFGMAVEPAAQGLGYGSALVGAALELARNRKHLRLVQLTVTDGNLSAERLYQRHGFIRFGVEPMAVAVDGGFVDKVHMWTDLRSGKLPA